MRNVLLVLALLAVSPLLWQPLRGQSPSIGVKSSSQKNQQPKLTGSQPQTDQRGTKDAPFVVDTKGHQNTKEEAAEDKKAAEQKDLSDRWTLNLAFAVAVFTGLLVFVGVGGIVAAIRTLRAIERQADLMEQQAKESRESATSDMAIAQRAADAALVSAEVSKQSLQVTQRAFFTFARYQTITMFEKPNNEGSFMGFRFSIEYENVGKTPAIDAEMILGFRKLKKGEPREFMIPAWENREGPRIASTVAPGMKVVGLLELEPEEAERIASGDLSVFLYTQAQYRDVFTDTHTHRSGTCIKLIKIADFRSGSPFQFKLHSPEHNYGD